MSWYWSHSEHKECQSYICDLYVHHEMDREGNYVKFVKSFAVINFAICISVLCFINSVFLSPVVFVKKRVFVFFKSKDPAFSLVPSSEVLLNTYAIIAKGKPRCKCAELHCQMRSITIPVGQLCTSALPCFLCFFQVCFIQNQTWLLDKKKISEQARGVLLCSYV